MDEAFTESAQRFSQIIDFLPDATFAIDTAGKVIAWNRAIEEMTGVSAEEMLGKGDYECAIPFYGVRRPMLVDLSFKSDEEIQSQYSYVKRRGNGVMAEGEVCLKGETRTLWGVASLLYDELGNVTGSIESVRDITEAKISEKALHAAHNELEQRVEERTAKLLDANRALKAQIIERKRAEDELAKTNEYLENILQNSPDGIGIVDARGKFQKWNRAAAEQYGYSIKELNEKSAFELYADKNELEEMLRVLRREGAVKKYPIDMKKKDGAIATFEISISLFRDGADRVIGSICVARDMSPLMMAFDALQKEIGRRREIEEALRESEAVYRESEKKYKSLYQEFHALLDAIPDGLVLLTPDLKAVWVNRFFADKFAKGEDVIGRHCHEIVHDTQAVCDNCPAVRSFRTGQRANAEIVTPAGEILEVRSVPVIDENGRIVNVINVTRDITESRQGEEELFRTYTELAQLLLSIPSFLIGLTPDQRITRWNSAAEQTFGISAEIAEGRQLADCGIQWNGKKVSNAICGCLQKGGTARLDGLRFVRPDGKEGFLNLTISSVRGETRGLSGVLLLGSDVTEHKIMESQLVQAQKLESIGQLAAGIAHEINTPAQYVSDNATFLQDAFRDLEQLHRKYDRLIELTRSAEPARDLIDAIEASAERIDLEYLRQEIPRAIQQSLEGIGRISKIVRAMKEFSHPGTEGKTNVDLNSAIESTITVAGNEWKYVAEMVTDLDPALPLVACLPGEINQVILNMIINATHAVMEARDQRGSEAKGTISISTRAREGFAEIRVSDTGLGIREDIRSKIFDPFFTTKEVGRGTGQGLAICHSVVVDKHGGTVSFETEVGKGTSFLVRLPIQGSAEN